MGRKRLPWIVIAGGTFAIGTAAIVRFSSLPARADDGALFALTQKAGIPTTFDELAPRHVGPDSTNAATYGALLPAADARIPRPIKAAFEKAPATSNLVAPEFEEYYDLVEKAAACPEWVPPPRPFKLAFLMSQDGEIGAGEDELPRDFVTFKLACNRLGTRSMARFANGDFEGCKQDLGRIVAIRNMVARYPHMTAVLMANAYELVAQNAVLTILSKVTSSQMGELSGVLAKCEPVDYAHAMETDAALCCQFACHPVSVESMGIANVGRPQADQFERTRSAWGPKVIETWRTTLVEVRQHPDDPVAAEQTIEKKVAEVASAKDSRNNAFFSIMPDYGTPLQSIVRFKARRELLTAGMAAVATHSPPVVGTDPFDRHPYRFKTTDKGWILYSIGMNLKDDGGEPDLVNHRDLVCSWDGKNLQIRGI